MSQATYIYGEREYILTGREAHKERTRRTGTQVKVEIQPADLLDKEDKTQNKWVYMKDLYHVSGEDDE